MSNSLNINNQIYHNEQSTRLLPNKYYFRQSAVSRALLGTFFTSTTGILINLAFIKLKKLPSSIFIKNIKQITSLSFFYFSTNELTFAWFNFNNLYTNYWVCYTISAYISYRLYYLFLIKSRSSQWFISVLYSQKICMMMLTYSLIIESVLELLKESITYDEPDILDKIDYLFDNKGRVKVSPEDFKEELPLVIFLNSEKKRRNLASFISDQTGKNGQFINMAAYMKIYKMNI